MLGLRMPKLKNSRVVWLLVSDDVYGALTARHTALTMTLFLLRPPYLPTPPSPRLHRDTKD